jgi:Mrp family chromosome partitioning ATPase
MDETLIVTKDGGTAKADLLATKDSLSKVGAKLAGLVFNMVNRKATKNYYYYSDNK